MASLRRNLRALTDSDPTIRQSAAYTLSLTGDRRAVEPLVQALNDEDWSVRLYVVMALGVIGDQQAVGPLALALEDTDSGVRHAAVMALGGMGAPAVDPLIRALNDEDLHVRKEAAESLGKIGDQRAVEPLKCALNDEDWSVHSEAEKALEKLGKEQASDTLARASEDIVEDSPCGTHPEVGGLIAYFGLADWWFSFFNDEERAYIERTYRPFSASVGGDQRGCMLTTGNVVSASGSRTHELSSLASWFHIKEDRCIACRILEYAEETMGSLDDLALEDGEVALRRNNEGTSILDAHFLYLQMIRTYYKDRDDVSGALDKTIQECEKQIAIGPQAARAFRAETWSHGPLEHTGYKQLTIIRDKQGDYAAAIRLCEEAKAQGWAGDWDKRIARYSKKAGAQAETET